VWDLGVPVLGICYGMFTMAVQQGGQVEASDHREFGYAEVRAHGHTQLLSGIEDFSTPEGHGMLKVWMSHGDKVTALPPGFKLMASTPSCPIAGMADEARRFYAVQFHPEVTHTVQGRPAAAPLRARHRRLRGRLDHGRPTSTRRWRASASRWATRRSSSACRAASIPAWRRR
jgi:GMP synthase (glutamine-hydrolysing) A subunit